jgi:hypothetical protein
VRHGSSTSCAAPSKGLAGGIRRTETIAQCRVRAEQHDEAKPQFGDLARDMGEVWQDDGPRVEQAARAKMWEAMLRKFGERGGEEGLRRSPW